MIGKEEIVIGFKSARSRMACGVGEKGKPMSENSAYKRLSSLETKGCLRILATERTGRRIRLLLPNEIPGVIPAPKEEPKLSIEEMDFFNVPANRKLILEREDHRCFYCLLSLTKDNYVIEYLVLRPKGNNSYRNVVAACRQCNNRKGNSTVEEFLRMLYRDDFLSAQEFEERRLSLEKVCNGELKPKISD